MEYAEIKSITWEKALSSGWWFVIFSQCKTLNWIAFDEQFPVQIAAAQVSLKTLT